MKFLRSLKRAIPTLITALLLSIAVWVTAVNQADPTEERIYPKTIALDIIGLDSELVQVNEITRQVSLTLKAPKSILDRLASETNLIHATLDLTGLSEGEYSISPQINISASPVDVVRISPQNITVHLENLLTKSMPITVQTSGELAIGFQADDPILSHTDATVSGPQTAMDRVAEIAIQLNIENLKDSINASVELVALDANANAIENVNILPKTINVNLPIKQLGGYRTVVVKVVTSGQIADGFRLTNIFAFPPTVTIFSTNPTLIEGIPGYVETAPISLTGASESFETNVTLNLPEGVILVGDSSITVQIGIAPIESSISLSNISVTIIGLDEGLSATISPETVDIVIAGPLSLLESLNINDIVVVLDLTNRQAGVYQLLPVILLDDDKLTVQAILPGTIEVTITQSTAP